MRKTVLTLAVVGMTAAIGLCADSMPTKNDVPVVMAVENGDVSTFCKAIVKGDFETVKRLIDLGEDVNQKSVGMTPAMFAARFNKAEILQLLIDKGADLKMRSNQGFTVRKYAELSNATDALAVLDAASGS